MKDERQSERIRFRLNDEAETFKRRERKHEKGFSGLVILAVILFFLFWFSVLLLVPYKQWSFDPAYFFETVSRNFKEFFAFVFGTRSAPGMQGRFISCLAAIVAGAALASCGAVFQGSFRNALAGPSTMGVMTGGTLGVLAYLLIFVPAHPEVVNEVHTQEMLDAQAARPLYEVYTQQLFVFAGCLIAVALILGISMTAGHGKVSGPAMIISGTVFSAGINNVIQIVQYYMLVKDPTDTRIDSIRDMMLGNLNDITSFRTLALMSVPILICLVILLCVRNRLNLLSFGEDEALIMGMNVHRYRVFLTIISTIMTASVVSFCGQIGFMGFMIPLVGRKIAGPNMKYLLPACMMLGAMMLLVVYDVACFMGMQDSLNIFTSSVGCIVMIFVLIGKKGDRSGAAFQGRFPQGMGIRP